MFEIYRWIDFTWLSTPETLSSFYLEVHSLFSNHKGFNCLSVLEGR